MNVFITGSTGLLGSTLLRTAQDNYNLGASFHINKLVPNVNCQYQYVDIRSFEDVHKAFFTFKPDVVIHTAAQASPDYCDKHKKESWEVNVGGTKNIVSVCESIGAKLVFITTNGVYDGRNPPYNEKAKPCPLDHYGKTKAKGEEIVESSNIPWIIVRLITMYGWNNPNQRQNPVTWLIQLVRDNKISVNIVEDMYNNFLFVEEAARSIWSSVHKEYYGEKFNIAGADCISRYKFSMQIAQEFNLDKKMIRPVKMNYFRNFVVRPKNTCFITDKMSQKLNIKPISTISGLKKMKKTPLSNTFWKSVE